MNEQWRVKIVTGKDAFQTYHELFIGNTSYGRVCEGFTEWFRKKFPKEPLLRTVWNALERPDWIAYFIFVVDLKLRGNSFRDTVARQLVLNTSLEQRMLEYYSLIEREDKVPETLPERRSSPYCLERFDSAGLDFFLSLHSLERSECRFLYYESWS
jgi:hypothetical protein